MIDPPRTFPNTCGEQNVKTGTRLNWIRASVMGANDGIVSIAALVVGVAGASTNTLSYILTAGFAGLLAGALSMAVGEYVSVSAQRDSQRSLLAKEKKELEETPQEEIDELACIYQAKGLQRDTALRVALELTQHDALAAHAEAELHIDPTDLTNPWHAAFASGIAFTLGGIIPMLAIAITPAPIRVLSTFAAVLVALVFTGSISAYVGGADQVRATARVVFGGFLAMLLTFWIGNMFGISGL